MKLKTIPIMPEPKEGDTKIERRFAWWPKRVEDKLIWLESYEVHYRYQWRFRIIMMRYFYHEGRLPGWDVTGLKLITPGLPGFKYTPPPPPPKTTT